MCFVYAQQKTLGIILEQREKIIPEERAPERRVIIVSGPTAVGKSAIGIRLAKALGGEVVSADSMQVYRGMDLGTAKVMPFEMEEINHHLIDIRDITEPFHVVDFYHEARMACMSILSRNRVPIIVGGSGFYLHALLYGPPEGPPSDPAIRKKLEDKLEMFGADALYAELEQVDPLYAETITCHDKHKIVRALEIIHLGGVKVSDLKWKQHKPSREFDFRCWFLHRPRSSLYSRIDHRCDKMLEQGFLEEVVSLDKQGLRQNTSASQAIGYRQALEFLQTSQTRADYKKFVEDFKTASRHYVKKQFTWFRQEKLFHWLDLDLHDVETAVDIIISDYENARGG